MDLGTLLGIISGFGLVIIAMSMGGGFGAFVNAPSLMIVCGGTIGATLINYPISDILKVIKVAKNAFFSEKIKTKKIIETLIEMSKISRRDGILGLEKTLKDIKDPFFVKGMTLMIDGIEPTKLSELLDTEVEYIEERHRLGAEIFMTMGNFAPAMGMVGTLIGLVKMLMDMSDPSSIGPSMAVALLTTFYGVILANLIFLPISGKLKTRSAKELATKQLVMSGILSVQSGDNPRMLEQKLHSFVSPNERKTVF
ncbi:MAG: motility protein A [Bacteroidota bacterium]|nr:motility protein A [Bacteroidota bacterium]